jgi:hypothetical protein
MHPQAQQPETKILKFPKMSFKSKFITLHRFVKQGEDASDYHPKHVEISPNTAAMSEDA